MGWDPHRHTGRTGIFSFGGGFCVVVGERSLILIDLRSLIRKCLCVPVRVRLGWRFAVGGVGVAGGVGWWLRKKSENGVWITLF